MKLTALNNKVRSIDILIVSLLAVSIITLVALLLTHVVNMRSTAVACGMLLFAGGVYFAVRAVKTGELRRHTFYKNDLSDIYKLEENEPEDNAYDEEPADMQEDSLELFESDIKAIDPEMSRQDDVITFRYQGGYFQAQPIGDNLVRISFPKIFSAGVLYQDMVCRSINRINTMFAVCKLVATPNTEDMSIEAHAFADISYHGDADSRIKFLTDVFAVFFEMQRSLLVSMSVSETLEMSPDAPETGEVTSSYKDISLN